MCQAGYDGNYQPGIGEPVRAALAAPAILRTRPAEITDIGGLMNTDLKCFDAPWPTDMWRECPHKCSLVSVGGNVAGFVVFTALQFIFPGSERYVTADDVWIVRMGVKPEYRNKGLGSLLLDRVLDFADHNKARRIAGIVSENTVVDLRHWLTKRKFLAAGIVNNCFTEYGDDTDGILWQRKLRG